MSARKSSYKHSVVSALLPNDKVAAFIQVHLDLGNELVGVPVFAGEQYVGGVYVPRFLVTLIKRTPA